MNPCPLITPCAPQSRRCIGNGQTQGNRLSRRIPTIPAWHLQLRQWTFGFLGEITLGPEALDAAKAHTPFHRSTPLGILYRNLAVHVEITDESNDERFLA